MTRPAILGGEPAFPDGLPFVRPPVPAFERVAARVRPSYDRGMLTNGPVVRDLEAAVAERIGVDHVLGVSSCTAGLMLCLRALDPGGPVAMPSFTFSATAHAAAWNGLEPRFVECTPDGFQVDTTHLGARLDGAKAILATHVFGAACDVETVEGLARDAGVPVVFDAAHGLGGARQGTPLGRFGTAEVFSLTPTKLVVGGEGGLVCTDDAELAEAVRIGRDYANPGDYDSRFVGLNGRLSELHAAMAIESLADLDEHLEIRRRLADAYKHALAEVPGIRLQAVDAGDETTYKDFTIAFDEAFGVRRDVVKQALKADGIDTRAYFSPPVHRHQAYAHLDTPALPVTDDVAGRVLSLPFYRDLTPADAERVVMVLAAIQRSAEEVDTAGPA